MKTISLAIYISLKYIFTQGMSGIYTNKLLTDRVTGRLKTTAHKHILEWYLYRKSHINSFLGITFVKCKHSYTKVIQ